MTENTAARTRAAKSGFGDLVLAPSGGNVGSVLDHTVETPGADDLVDNKVLDCTVVAPLGESLHRFETVPELLQALRDAVKAHRSLYQDGEILHQDVCPGNIIIPSSPSSSTYLPDNPQTYRQDLESFFYTFLFLATCERPVAPGENQLHPPPGTVLSVDHGWPVDQVRSKTNDMDAADFDRIIAEFTPEFRRLTGLATTLRGILFPTRDGEL
ncbi:hypothetical protein CPLU01_04858 [Colletotrichum plurivorum]|uniref:Fungal-type protein kinase domain-containing protein n=1 Tax=Colletotrichum plurivorum TaxID=2175906 RepID=A0A8H6NIZ2_9PEZI|nr:hypothetical protein CPLU01_04858 [Colletotrichum plurivorum]